jgi:hypothetical protein
MDDLEPRRKSWWGRNWFWVVPLGCLTPIVAVVGCVVITFVVIEGSLKSSDAYAHSKAAVINNDKVRAALGEPIESGTFVTGNINVSTSGGHADITYSLAGSKGTATVHAIADKQAGKWVLSTNHVVISPTNEELDILVNP